MHGYFFICYLSCYPDPSICTGAAVSQVVEWLSSLKVCGSMACLHVEVSLIKKLNPKFLPKLCQRCVSACVNGYYSWWACGSLQGCHCHHCVYVCMIAWMLTYSVQRFKCKTPYLYKWSPSIYHLPSIYHCVLYGSPERQVRKKGWWSSLI